jgi:hypothetical protein
MAQIIYVAARVHVYRVHQARVMRDEQMVLKCLDSNLPIGCKWHQGSGNPMYFSSKLALFDASFDLHRTSGWLRFG